MYTYLYFFVLTGSSSVTACLREGLRLTLNPVWSIHTHATQADHTGDFTGAEKAAGLTEARRM